MYDSILWRLARSADEEQRAADTMRGRLLAPNVGSDERRMARVALLSRQQMASSLTDTVRRAVRAGHGDVELRSRFTER